jgi:mannose-6-phosphate isomerase-like protein (cupin superfamily)
LELIDNAEVRKFYFEGNWQQTLAGTDQGLKTFEVWRLSLAPGKEIPAFSPPVEVVALTMEGTGRVVVEGKPVDIRPDTTLVIPRGASRQIVNTGQKELVVVLIRSIVPA